MLLSVIGAFISISGSPAAAWGGHVVVDQKDCDGWAVHGEADPSGTDSWSYNPASSGDWSNGDTVHGLATVTWSDSEETYTYSFSVSKPGNCKPPETTAPPTTQPPTTTAPPTTQPPTTTAPPTTQPPTTTAPPRAEDPSGSGSAWEECPDTVKWSFTVTDGGDYDGADLMVQLLQNGSVVAQQGVMFSPFPGTESGTFSGVNLDGSYQVRFELTYEFTIPLALEQTVDVSPDDCAPPTTTTPPTTQPPHNDHPDCPDRVEIEVNAPTWTVPEEFDGWEVWSKAGNNPHTNHGNLPAGTVINSGIPDGSGEGFKDISHVDLCPPETPPTTTTPPTTAPPTTAPPTTQPPVTTVPPTTAPPTTQPPVTTVPPSSTTTTTAPPQTTVPPTTAPPTTQPPTPPPPDGDLPKTGGSTTDMTLLLAAIVFGLGLMLTGASFVGRRPATVKVK